MLVRAGWAMREDAEDEGRKGGKQGCAGELEDVGRVVCIVVSSEDVWVVGTSKGKGQLQGLEDV